MKSLTVWTRIVVAVFLVTIVGACTADCRKKEDNAGDKKKGADSAVVLAVIPKTLPI